ncbi:unnamed protein product [Lymnaea stagnalis]|uniref:Cystatin domain-containing protein n=1 Tax=Lymnaea stagnalis TaxID=6523 RepID=A0AAV2IQ70_LYMST
MADHFSLRIISIRSSHGRLPSRIVYRSEMMCGGTSDVKPASDEVHDLIKKIKDDLEKKSQKTFSNFKAVSYKSQVVAGTNFFVKIQGDGDEYLHVRIYRPLPHTNEGPSLHSYQLGKSKDDDIEYFY